MEKTGNSRILLLVLLLFICVIVGCTNNKSSSKTFTVGVVNLNEDHEKIFLGFKMGLAELGYTEGKNITYIYNGTRSKAPELENDLQSFIDQKIDLILSITTPATKKAKKMTAGTGIPVVFAPVFDPVKSGIVGSLVKPGGNLTGIKVGGHSAKALDWLLKVAPDIKNIFVPLHSNILYGFIFRVIARSLPSRICEISRSIKESCQIKGSPSLTLKILKSEKMV